MCHNYDISPLGKRKRGKPATTKRRALGKERERIGWKTWGQAEATVTEQDGRWKLRANNAPHARHVMDRLTE